ncbi:chromate efflux transporter [Tropicimonas sp. S265A]|uniref:chromate efflux transporter n=1 Tax=Tropicimonas sp. S265A TaxID=3415134 RepID=UPI003C7C4906
MTSTPAPSLSEIARVFGRIGLLSFGGPAAQIAMLQTETVDRRPWLTGESFATGLSFCMLLPGPEAMQLATWCGWRLRGLPGGVIAGGLFVLPGALVILILALVYAYLGDVPLVRSLFLGVQAAVVAIVVQALIRLSARALTRRSDWVIAALSFAALFVFDLPFPLVLAVAALYGATRVTSHGPSAATLPRPNLPLVAGFIALWWGPILALWLSGAALLTQIALFFSKLAVVTFGGAYAVLAYMAQEVVEERAWLDPAEMIDALGLAETTPGPLILVTEFVGFLAGFGAGGAGLGIAAAVVTLWVTFVPCFLWIFALGPYIDWVSGQPRLAGALSGVMAAVVGVIAALALWFAMQVLFSDQIAWVLPVGLGTLGLPVLSSVNLVACALSGFAAVLLWANRLGVPAILAICAGGALAASGL